MYHINKYKQNVTVRWPMPKVTKLLTPFQIAASYLIVKNYAHIIIWDSLMVMTMEYFVAQFECHSWLRDTEWVTCVSTVYVVFPKALCCSISMFQTSIYLCFKLALCCSISMIQTSIYLCFKLALCCSISMFQTSTVLQYIYVSN